MYVAEAYVLHLSILRSIRPACCPNQNNCLMNLFRRKLIRNHVTKFESSDIKKPYIPRNIHRIGYDYSH